MLSNKFYLKNCVQGDQFELPETQFERTVRDKIACKTYLEWENDYFKLIFGIL